MMQAETIIPALQIGHGVFNALLCVAFFAQGRLGWKIRAGRRAGAATDFSAVKKHRRRGPALILLLAAGYLAGTVTAVAHQGRFISHPLHFGAGTLLVALAGATFLISRGIRGPDSRLRAPHALLGIAILGVFVVQVFLGLGVLL